MSEYVAQCPKGVKLFRVGLYMLAVGIGRRHPLTSSLNLALHMLDPRTPRDEALGVAEELKGLLVESRYCCIGPVLHDAFALISSGPGGLAQIFEPWFRRFGDTLARVLDRIATVAAIERNRLRTKNMLTAGNGNACNYVARNLLEDRRAQAVASARAATELSSIVQPQASLADEGRNEITPLKK